MSTDNDSKVAGKGTILTVLHMLEAAKAELREAVAYYNEQSFGLGDELLREVEESLAQIENDPFRFSASDDRLLRRRQAR